MQKGSIGGDSAVKKWVTYILLAIAGILIAVFYYPFSLAILYGSIRYFTHMLQLSSYQWQGYSAFLRKNRKHIVVWAVAGAVLLLWWWSDIRGIFSFLVHIYASYLTFFYWPRKEKKKFVVTPRVRRLLLVTYFLFLIPIIILTVDSVRKAGMVGGMTKIAAFDSIPFVTMVPFALCLGLLPFVVALANRINKPVEQSINNGFIKDAVRILKEQPRLRIIGVTGSYGKTSVKHYLTTILSEQFDVLMTPESYNTPMGVVRTIREQMKPTHEIFVCEMGARHVGDIREITDFVHPDDGVLTAIGEQHMETFFTQENIVKTKFELLDAVEEKHPQSTAEKAGTLPGAAKPGCKFVNGDNGLIRANMKYPDAITYGLEEGNDFRAIDLNVTGAGTTFKIQLSERIARRLTGEQGYAVKTPVQANSGMEFHTVLVGAHNIQNITGAIAVAVMYGIPVSKIRMGVRRIEPVPHRLELKTHGNITILDDAFNANPAGAKAALDTLSLFEDAVRILVTPGMVELGDREDALNETFGRQAAAVCDYIILVGETQTAAVRKGILEAGFDERRLFVERSFQNASRRMYELDAGREKVILLENDLPDNYERA